MRVVSKKATMTMEKSNSISIFYCVYSFIPQQYFCLLRRLWRHPFTNCPHRALSWRSRNRWPLYFYAYNSFNERMKSITDTQTHKQIYIIGEINKEKYGRKNVFSVRVSGADHGHFVILSRFVVFRDKQQFLHKSFYCTDNKIELTHIFCINNKYIYE